MFLEVASDLRVFFHIANLNKIFAILVIILLAIVFEVYVIVVCRLLELELSLAFQDISLHFDICFVGLIVDLCHFHFMEICH